MKSKTLNHIAALYARQDALIQSGCDIIKFQSSTDMNYHPMVEDLMALMEIPQARSLIEPRLGELLKEVALEMISPSQTHKA